MNTLIFTLGYITFIVLFTYLIYKLLVMIKLLITGKARKYFSKPMIRNTDNKQYETNQPQNIRHQTNGFIGFLNLVKNEKLFSTAKISSRLKGDSHNLAYNNSIQPIGKFVKPNFKDSRHSKRIISRKGKSA